MEAWDETPCVDRRLSEAPVHCVITTPTTAVVILKQMRAYIDSWMVHDNIKYYGSVRCSIHMSVSLTYLRSTSAFAALKHHGVMQLSYSSMELLIRRQFPSFRSFDIIINVTSQISEFEQRAQYGCKELERGKILQMINISLIEVQSQ
jgi:hypothetical protein